MITITNPILAHAYGRALAHLPEVELVDGLFQFPGGKLRWPAFYNRRTQDVRVVMHYPRVAKRGSPYLVTVRAGLPQWHPDTVPLDFADLEEHTLWVTFVAQLQPFDPIRLSKANQPAQYRYFSQQQHEAGIDWQHPQWIHPYDRLTKDSIILLLLQGETFDTSAVTDEAAALFADEKDVMQGRIYSKIKQEGQPT